MPQSFAEQFRSIPMSPNLGASLERAHGFAREQAHRSVLLEHLLLALTEDPDAAIVLKASNVDLDRLGTDVSGYLGGLLEDMRAENGAEPRPDAELLRVMQAAGQAAQQSRRKQIDGAIVLAAVVGDGKSPAAGLLKAHGLTFEEAIRALQKASAQLRSKKYATPPPAAAEPARPEAAPTPASQEAASPASGQPQSVDDILAAARARIKQRSWSSAGNKAESSPPAPEPPSPTEPEPLSSLASAAAAKSAKAAVEGPDPADDDADLLEGPPAPRAAAAPPSESSAPPPTPQQPVARAPQRTAPPFAQRGVQAGDGPPRPPPQQRGGSGGAPQPGLPPRAPRPSRPDRAGANGAGPAARPGAPPRPGQRSGSGPLVEAIPRRMRVGVPASAQVRIARDKIDGLIHLLLNGRGMPQRPDAFATRALSVRLRAPEGGFWIEPASPETVWADTGSGLQPDEQASWRWTVTPQASGRGRLVLLVTARLVGRDGIAAETAPPDRVIEVMVRGNPLRSAVRWIGLLALILAGMALGQYGHEVWEAVVPLIKGLVG